MAGQAERVSRKVDDVKFRKKPVVIEAEQLQVSLIPSPEGAWVSRNNPFGVVVMRRPRWWMRPRPMVKTLEGWLEVSPFDWIIKGVKGEFYPCKPDIFEATYEKV